MAAVRNSGTPERRAGGNPLPEGWVVTELGKVVDYGRTQKVELKDVDQSTWVLELEDIEKGTSKLLQRLNASERAFKSTKNKFESGDVLYGKLRPYLNKVIIADDGGVCTTEIIPLNAEPNVSNLYLFHWLKSKDFLDYVNEVSYGVNMPRLGTKDAIVAPIVIPPLAEQHVIAEKLDTLLAQVDTTKAHLERIPDIIKRFRQSVLAAAVSGKLTEKWRDDHRVGFGKYVINEDEENKSLLLNTISSLQKKKSSIECAIDSDYIFDLPDSWAFTTWGKVSEWITYGFTKPMPKSDSGIKLLTAKDVQYFQININDAGFTTNDAFESLSDKDRPIKGDLLITKDGSIGRAALVRTEEQFCINQSVAVCWLRSTKMNKDYLEYLANSEFTQKFVKDKAQGMAIQHLSIIDYAKCPLPVPPKEEQNEIVRRVEELFAFADSIEQNANAALERVNNLTQSILAKAFRGELTADWRAANPELISAEALLEKIKIERESIKKQPKPKRTAGKKKTGSCMSKQIIKVVDALKMARGPLSGQQLLAAAGYPSDSSTDQLEQFFLDIREALVTEKAIIKIKRDDDDQDWFSLAESATNE